MGGEGGNAIVGLLAGVSQTGFVGPDGVVLFELMFVVDEKQMLALAASLGQKFIIGAIEEGSEIEAGDGA